MPLLQELGDARKVVLSPMVRYFRNKCCSQSGHCTNQNLPSYKKGMLRDLAEVKEAIREGLMENGLRGFKVLSPCELLGMSGDMEDDELGRMLGEDPIHMTDAGFVSLAEKLCKLLEDDKLTFQGEKRSREKEPELPEGEEVGSLRRRYTEWLFFTVSGEGRWSDARATGRGGGGRGRGGGFGGWGGGRGGVSTVRDRLDGRGRGESSYRLGPKLYRD